MQEPAPRLKTVEWVADHGEAHGQLLVRGVTLDEIIERAQAAIGTQQGRLRIHPGWWRTEICRCRRTLASSNHPAWHYRAATATDAGAWRGAEVRIVLRPAGATLR
jgi:hypothetical protein